MLRLFVLVLALLAPAFMRAEGESAGSFKFPKEELLDLAMKQKGVSVTYKKSGDLFWVSISKNMMPILEFYGDIKKGANALIYLGGSDFRDYSVNAGDIAPILKRLEEFAKPSEVKPFKLILKPAGNLNPPLFFDSLSKALTEPDLSKIAVLKKLPSKELLAKAKAGDEYAALACVQNRLLNEENAMEISGVIFNNSKTDSGIKQFFADLLVDSFLYNMPYCLVGEDSSLPDKEFNNRLRTFRTIVKNNGGEILKSLTCADVETAVKIYMLAIDEEAVSDYAAFIDAAISQADASRVFSSMFSRALFSIPHYAVASLKSDERARALVSKIVVLWASSQSDNIGEINFYPSRGVNINEKLIEIILFYNLSDILLELDKGDKLDNFSMKLAAAYIYDKRAKFMTNLKGEDLAFVEKRLPALKSEIFETLKSEKNRGIDFQYSICKNDFVKYALLEFPLLKSVDYVNRVYFKDKDFQSEFYAKLKENYELKQVVAARADCDENLFFEDLKNSDNAEVREALKQYLESKIQAEPLRLKSELAALALSSYRSGSLLEKSDEKAIALAKKIAAGYDAYSVYNYLCGNESIGNCDIKVALDKNDEALKIIEDGILSSDEDYTVSRRIEILLNRGDTKAAVKALLAMGDTNYFYSDIAFKSLRKLKKHMSREELLQAGELFKRLKFGRNDKTGDKAEFLQKLIDVYHKDYALMFEFLQKNKEFFKPYSLEIMAAFTRAGQGTEKDEALSKSLYERVNKEASADEIMHLLERVYPEYKVLQSDNARKSELINLALGKDSKSGEVLYYFASELAKDRKNPEKVKKAAELYLKAIDCSDFMRSNSAYVYRYFALPEPCYDPKVAFEIASKLAERFNSEEMRERLATHYLTGLGCEKDEKKALEILKDIVRKNPGGIAAVVLAYCKEKGIAGESLKEGEKYELLSNVYNYNLSDAAHSFCSRESRLKNRTPVDRQYAFEMLEYCISKNIHAKDLLWTIYGFRSENRQYADPEYRDIKVAWQTLMRIKNLNPKSDRMKFQEALHLLVGAGVEANPEAAAKTLSEIADTKKGFWPGAALVLCYAYEKGIGVEANPELAAKYFKLCTESDVTFTCYGNIIRYAEVMPYDKEWFESFRDRFYKALESN